MKNIFKRNHNKQKYKYMMGELSNMNKHLSRIIRAAKPEDFNVFPQQRTIYLMSEPMETVTQWVLSVTNKNNVVYTLGRYSSEAQAYRMMRLVIKHRLLPEYHAPTLRELMEQQEVA